MEAPGEALYIVVNLGVDATESNIEFIQLLIQVDMKDALSHRDDFRCQLRVLNIVQGLCFITCKFIKLSKQEIFNILCIYRGEAQIPGSH